MKAKLTHKFIMLEWLKHKMTTHEPIPKGAGVRVASHEFESDFPSYAKLYWGVTLLPSTASRLWRQIRSDEQYKDIGIDDVRSLYTQGTKEKSWALMKIS